MTWTTDTHLLVGLRDPHNSGVWSAFYAAYQPLLIAFGRQLGLRDQDAQDAAHDALLSFAAAYRQGRYERGKGRLRSWLFGIARNKIHDLQRRRGREGAIVDSQPGTGLMSQVPDEHTWGAIWEAEWERWLLRRCVEQVRRQVEPTTMQAFELFVLREWPADRVGSHLGLSRNAVFKAKRRVLTRLREAYQSMQMDG